MNTSTTSKPQTTSIIALQILSCIFSVAVFLFILIQQLFYSNEDVTFLATTVFVFLHFIDLLPLLLTKERRNVAVSTANAYFIVFWGLFYVLLTGGTPSPISDLQGFINGIGGMWSGILTVEVIVWIAGLYGRSIIRSLGSLNRARKYRERQNSDKNTEKSSAGEAAAANISGQSPSNDRNQEHRRSDSAGSSHTPVGSQNSDKYPFTGQHNDSGNSTGRNDTLGKRENRRDSEPGTKPGGKKGDWLPFIIFLIIAIGFPLLPTSILDGWISAVGDFTYAVTGIESENSALFSVIIYIGMAMIAAFTIPFAKKMFDSVRTSIGSDEKPNFFSEYSTPLTLVLLVIITFLALRSSQSGENGFDLVSFVSNWFAYLIPVVIAIIACCFILEAVRIVLVQCLEKGSLLKTYMRLIYLEIIQLAANLFFGVIKLFAFRDMLESLLLFFVPDAGGGIDEKVDQTGQQALNMEMESIAEEMWEKRRKKAPESGNANTDYLNITETGRTCSHYRRWL